MLPCGTDLVQAIPLLSNMIDNADGHLVVASTSLHRLFSGESIPASDNSAIHGRLHLPEYQRSYRWDSRLVYDLYQDILAHFQGGPEREAYDYYLGSIILHQSSAHGDCRLNIIDGQQRLTSVALLCSLAGMSPVPDLRFRALKSQQRVLDNLAELRGQVNSAFDLARINVTLVVTRSEDDAYRFFETQNSGGVRLDGAAIIKAHHLRAIDPAHQDAYARSWENMKELPNALDSVMRGRHWQTLSWRSLASRDREPVLTRKQIVQELAYDTGDEKVDEKFNQVRLRHAGDGWQLQDEAARYAMRQPLDAGVNTVHFLQQFNDVHREWCNKDEPVNATPFQHYYFQLVAQSDASAFLTKLYDCALAMYVSQFGSNKLLEASLRLFRVVFSPRLSNERMVRESTVQRFVRDTPVLDWITSSYTHAQLMKHLTEFNYKVAPENLDTRKGVKRRFVDKVIATLAMDLRLGDDAQPAAIASRYDAALQSAIIRIVPAPAYPHGRGAA